MKKRSEKSKKPSSKTEEHRPSLNDLYYTDDFDLEEELRLMEEDPKLKDVTVDPATKVSLFAEISRREKIYAEVEEVESRKIYTTTDTDKTGVVNIDKTTATGKIDRVKLHTDIQTLNTENNKTHIYTTKHNGVESNLNSDKEKETKDIFNRDKHPAAECIDSMDNVSQDSHIPINGNVINIEEKHVHVNNSGSNKKDSTINAKLDQYAGLSVEDRELLELGRQLRADEQSKGGKRYAFRMSRGRVAAAVASVLILSMGVSTEGFTSPFKYLQSVEKGEENEFLLVESEGDAVEPSGFEEELDVYKQVDDFFQIPVVKLYGFQADLEFQQINLNQDLRSADILYTHESNSIMYSIMSNYNKVSKMRFVDTDKIDEYTVIEKIHEIKVTKYTGNTEGVYRYSMVFEYNTLYYEIWVLDVNEGGAEKIIKNIN